MKLIKQSSEESKNFIFAITTPHSLEWKVKDLISGLQAKQGHFKEDGRQKSIQSGFLYAASPFHLPLRESCLFSLGRG